MATYYESDGTPSADDDKKAGGPAPILQVGTYDANGNKLNSSELNDLLNGSSSGGVAAGTPSTISGSAGSGVNVISPPNNRPGSRPYNPLSEFSSYTYNIALYMVTPEGYNQFVESGGTKPTQGCYLLAKSGGINKNVDDPRAPGLQYDLYIDDLKIKTLTATKQTNSATNSYDISFSVYEPYGFNFPTLLKEASLKVQQESSLPGVKDNPDSIKQQFLLEVRFTGYDNKGNVKTLYANNTDTSLVRIWPIQISKFQFSLSGKVTEYKIDAVNVGTQVSLGSKRGIVNNPIELNGATVFDVLAGTGSGKVLTGQSQAEDGKPSDNFVTGLFQSLNLAEDSLFEQGLVERLNSYQIEIDSVIADALMVSKDSYNKFKAPVSTNQTTTESTTSTDDPQSVETKKRTVSVAAGTPLLKIIDEVIGQSNYVESAFKVLSSEDPEADTEPNSKPAALQWYNVNPIVKITGYDTKRRDFTYDIKYVIKPYRVPFVRSAYVSNKTSYYGPHKRYEYWYTGKNNEIITFEQQFNNLFYIPTTVSPKTKSDEPTAPGQSAAMKSSTQETQAGEAVASVRSSLYSLGDLANAKMTIIGDPDYLVTSLGVSTNLYNTFYGKDFTVDPNSGQVFVEINFYEGVDYDSNKGTMLINDKIKFNVYPADLDKLIKGVVYNVIQVDSMFSKGKFTQDLVMLLWNVPTTATNNNASSQRSESNTTEAGTVRTPDIYYENDGTVSSSNTPKTTYYENDGSSSSTLEPAKIPNQSETSPTKSGTSVQDDDNTTSTPSYNPMGDYTGYNNRGE